MVRARLYMVVNKVSVHFNNWQKYNEGFALKLWWQAWQLGSRMGSRSCKTPEGMGVGRETDSQQRM